jgi:membrane protease subunit (stomatin/prohibitin family)
MTVQNVSLPEELQKILDQKIGMGMVGNDMGKFMQYQTAQAIPKFAEGCAVAAAAALPATPWAWAPAWRWARCWRRTCSRGCRAAAAGAAAAAAGGRGRRHQAEDVMATLEKLGDLKAKGILTEEEFRRQEGRAAEEAGLRKASSSAGLVDDDHVDAGQRPGL